MNHLQTFQIFPAIPQPLSFLEELSRNLWWSWQRDGIDLFRRIEPALWEQACQNPILFLSLQPQTRLEELATDASFLAHLERVRERYNRRVLTPVDVEQGPYGQAMAIGYFSMEFGIHESLPFFSGGLGILAGDHLKAASNLSIPLVGVGLLYRQGYFRQFLDQNGWQQEAYPELDFFHLPIARAKDRDGHEFAITVRCTDGTMHAIVWQLQVGRITLLLLDANIPENPPEVRDITSRLYAGEQKMRLNQEILLGIGGMRALDAMGIYPKVIHMNEGHSAFASLERLAFTIDHHGVDLKTALDIVPRTTVFTTHTPVAAGHDEFPADMVKPCVRPLRDRLNASENEIISWGQPLGAGPDAPLSMFVLALRMAQYCNGVSELHGHVARRMWAHVWPERPEDEVPIAHVTNGVHLTTWISSEISLLFENYLGPDWHLPPRNQDLIRRIDDIYDDELWRAHEMSRTRLLRACRKRMLEQYGRRNAPKTIMKAVEAVLDPDVLTIGFARRFATYKRATLLLSDPERLEAILLHEERPVQLVFAGKAHPKDNEGKEMISRITKFAQQPHLRHRVVFIEDYDPYIARHLLQGADVWLNTPRRPYEACGTSGMKAAINGVLNVSIMDGWWCEGYRAERGWSIGDGDEYSDHAYQDTVDSQALYNVLENDVIPLYYEKQNGGGVPTGWIQMMKASIKMAMNDFSAQRMVQDYERMFYQPAVKQYDRLLADGAAEAKRLNQQLERLRNHWQEVRINVPERSQDGPFRVGDHFRVGTEVHLGVLQPDEVEVELYYGALKSVDTLNRSLTQKMEVAESIGDGRYRYGCDVQCQFAGRYGLTARIIPKGDDRITFAPGLITWA